MQVLYIIIKKQSYFNAVTGINSGQRCFALCVCRVLRLREITLNDKELLSWTTYMQVVSLIFRSCEWDQNYE